MSQWAGGQDQAGQIPTQMRCSSSLGASAVTPDLGEEAAGGLGPLLQTASSYRGCGRRSGAAPAPGHTQSWAAVEADRESGQRPGSPRGRVARLPDPDETLVSWATASVACYHVG